MPSTPTDSAPHTTTQHELARVEGTAKVPHVVIVGGGFGGLAAAKALRKAPVRVTLVDRRNHHLFQPLLYQVASAVLSPSDIAEPIRAVLRNQANASVLLADVTDVDVDGRRLKCGERWLEYDALIVAAGMQNHWFGHDDWAVHAPGLKSLDDALEIRRRVLLAFERAEWCANPEERARLLTFVVVGAGPTGVELAGALSEISRQTLLDDFRNIDSSEARVVLIEGGDRVLPGLADPLPAKALRHLGRVGVDVRLNTRVTTVDERGVRLGGERIEAATVLWAAGVKAAPLGARLGAELDRQGRVHIQADLSLPDHPEVMVIGDMAHYAHGFDAPLPGVAQVALQMGKHCARNLTADRRGQPRKPFRYLDLGSMATIGRRLAVVDLKGLRFSGLIAWIAWLFVHLMALVGFRNRLVVLTQWAWSYFTFERNARLIRSDKPDSAL
jgi:NADH:ubiquinone reductase (H+-translocating)